MNLYQVSTKYGKRSYQLVAYVEADSPTEAVILYFGDDDRRNKYYDGGGRYKATLSELPESFWEMADYCRPAYIKAGPADNHA